MGAAVAPAVAPAAVAVPQDGGADEATDVPVARAAECNVELNAFVHRRRQTCPTP